MFELVAEQSQLASPACHHLPAGLELLSYPQCSREEAQKWLLCGCGIFMVLQVQKQGAVGWAGKVGARSVTVSLFMGLVHLTEGELVGCHCDSGIGFMHTDLGGKRKKTLHKTLLYQ